MKFWSEKSEGNRQIERPRHKRKRMHLRETGWEVVDWMHLAQDRD
jgi:hypothetical protein